MSFTLSPGKWQKLHSLTDEQGRFKMLAIDQRGSLARPLARATGQDTQQVTGQDLTAAKSVIIRALAPYGTAVLTDPEYGYPQSVELLPPRTGLLLAYEQSGHEKAGPGGRERITRLIEGWSAAQSQRSGADAVKLLLYYNPDASAEVVQAQQGLVQQVGEECRDADIPFLLELVAYPLTEESPDTGGFARSKPDLVIRSATEFSRPGYLVDVLKLEFPADLKWTREFSSGAFDGRERQPVYDLSEVRDFARQLDQASGAPWVILSAGVDISEFLVQVELATEAGASGFLCGRAIWKDVLPLYPDQARMEEWLSYHGAYNFERANAYAAHALPWVKHRRFSPAGAGVAAP